MRCLAIFLAVLLVIVDAQWGRPPVVVQKTIITRPGFGGGGGPWGGGPRWGGGGFGRGGGWGGGPPTTIIKKTIIRPG